MNTQLDDVASETGVSRTRSGLRRPARTTSRWHIGRLVRVSREAGCGFVRAPSGAIVYFALTDVVGGESVVNALRPGARLRFEPATRGVPRALAVAAL